MKEQTNKKNDFAEAGVFCILLVLIGVLLLFLGYSTSPLYKVYFGDYGGNETNAAMLIGKYWLNGEIPYRDLFGTEGPLYYFFMAAGWMLGQTAGVFALQILQISLAEFFCYKTLYLFLKRRTSILLTMVTLIPYAAMASGGCSSAEFCLLPVSVFIYLTVKSFADKKLFFSTGLIMSLCTVTALFTYVPAGLILICASAGVLAGKRENRLRWIVAYVCTAAAISALISIYFVCEGAFHEFSDAVFLYHFQMIRSYLSAELLIHKAIKGVPVLAFMIAAAFFYNGEEKAKVRKFCVCIGAITYLILLLSEGNWHCYLIQLYLIPLTLLILIQNGKMQAAKYLTAAAILLNTAIVLIPLRSEISYLKNFDRSYTEDMVAEISSNMQTKEISSIYIINGPDYLYRMLDLKPAYRYFSGQKQLFTWKEDIYTETVEYLESDYVNGLVINSSNGFLSDQIGAYTYVTSYITNHKNIGIYLYNPQETEE